MKGVLLEDYSSPVNTHNYEKGQTVIVSRLEEFPDSYAIYYHTELDWIPKKIIKLLE